MRIRGFRLNLYPEFTPHQSTCTCSAYHSDIFLLFEDGIVRPRLLLKAPCYILERHESIDQHNTADRRACHPFTVSEHAASAVEGYHDGRHSRQTLRSEALQIGLGKSISVLGQAKQCHKFCVAAKQLNDRQKCAKFTILHPSNSHIRTPVPDTSQVER
jgi:hypothetical protein